MSYLDPVRLHFAGNFQADVSTVNNTATYFDNEAFKRRYQQRPDGSWNPEGSGAWRLVGCKVTRVCYADGTSTTDPKADPIVGMSLLDANQRVSAKLVDLDPEQQMVSMIFGLLVRLSDGTDDLFAGPYEPAAFLDLWSRARNAPKGAQPLAAMYQSVIGPVTWGASDSRFLKELRGAAGDDLLSIKFNVDGYDRNPDSETFTYGRIVGTIGPASASEPRHLVVGRHLGSAELMKSRIPSQTNYMACVVDRDARRITADFGNSIPTEGMRGPLQDVGPIALGYLDSAGKFAQIANVDYLGKGWYETTAGVQSYALDDAALAALASQSVAVSLDGATILQENVDGTYVRADQFVFRVSTDEKAVDVDVDLWAMKWGVLQDGAEIFVQLDPAVVIMQVNAGWPAVATPDVIGGFDPATPLIAKQGRVTLTLTVADPGNPRGYIDGQVYGVRPLPPSVANGVAGAWAPFFDVVSLLIWTRYVVPDVPAWEGEMQPIFTQYGHLYPLMQKIVDLTSYRDVAENAEILEFVFALPVSNPNSMPVTRDLSPAKREAILKWLRNPDPETGWPREVSPPQAPQAKKSLSAAMELTAPPPQPVVHAEPPQPVNEAGRELFRLKSGLDLKEAE